MNGHCLYDPFWVPMTVNHQLLLLLLQTETNPQHSFTRNGAVTQKLVFTNVSSQRATCSGQKKEVTAFSPASRAYYTSWTTYHAKS